MAGETKDSENDIIFMEGYPFYMKQPTEVVEFTYIFVGTLINGNLQTS